MQDKQADKAEQLAQIAQAIEQDGVTPHLKQTATQLVFGVGSPTAELMFVGEAPGKNEDLQGEPFVGAAGKFLNEMLASIGLKRSDIYISNIVKYRPPDNRDPTPEEIAAFVPYLQRQIEVIGPKLVVFLGRHSMSVFLPELRISQAHGKPVRKGGQVYLPLFHPAAALYNPAMRETLLADFALIPAILKKIG
ncbi:MAG TPA: uracil-DNA glycosylase [Candidatus Saccharimonadia bacterium]|nr:uracil-DNA glycosylase [Candidatus Saccharimonadia bacterium]